jgi:hypothetical protein
MNVINYIEKTHEYYVRKGFSDPYRYAHFDDGPFKPVRKPVAESRLLCVSSAGMEIIPDDGPEPQPFKGRNIGEKDKVEVFLIPSDIPKEKLKYVTGAHNWAENDMLDIDAFFPVTRLRELRDEGRIGSLADFHLRIRPCYSQRKTVELDAPEVLRRCREQEVDAALLVPV